MPNKARHIESIPGLLHIIEQIAEPGHNSRALVQCPFCDKVFLKQRSFIRSSGHTACHCCWSRYLSPRAVYIKDIPGQLIVLEQYIDELADCGRALCLVRCPGCDIIHEAMRQNVMRHHSSFCQSCNQAGERNWRWKGGYSPSYGPRWNNLSQSVMERDGWACQLCGGTASDGRLHVHHIVPYSDSSNNLPGNLITLCPSCHGWADHNLDESVPMLDQLIDAIYHGF